MLVIHACPQCGAPAEQNDWFVLDSTDGPVPHVALHCARNHHFRMPVDMLPVAAAGAARIQLAHSGQRHSPRDQETNR